jgi:hypothetical protein
MEKRKKFWLNSFIEVNRLPYFFIFAIIAFILFGFLHEAAHWLAGILQGMGGRFGLNYYHNSKEISTTFIMMSAPTFNITMAGLFLWLHFHWKKLKNLTFGLSLVNAFFRFFPLLLLYYIPFVVSGKPLGLQDEGVLAVMFPLTSIKDQDIAARAQQMNYGFQFFPPRFLIPAISLIISVIIISFLLLRGKSYLAKKKGLTLLLLLTAVGLHTIIVNLIDKLILGL